MGLSYYFEVHVRRAGASGLRLRGVDVLTAQDDAGSELGDAELMDRARGLGRAIFTQDRDFLIEADRRQESGEACAGVIYAHQLKVTVGGVRRRLGIDRENLRARRKVVLQKL